jgi:hypothetical protein
MVPLRRRAIAYHGGQMELVQLGLFIIAFLYIALAVGAIVNIFLRRRRRA